MEDDSSKAGQTVRHKTKFNRDKSIDTLPSIKFKGFNLPLTMDFTKWGNIISQSDTLAIVNKLNQGGKVSKFNYHINIL